MILIKNSPRSPVTFQEIYRMQVDDNLVIFFASNTQLFTPNISIKHILDYYRTQMPSVSTHFCALTHFICFAYHPFKFHVQSALLKQTTYRIMKSSNHSFNKSHLIIYACRNAPFVKCTIVVCYHYCLDVFCVMSKKKNKQKQETFVNMNE